MTRLMAKYDSSIMEDPSEYLPFGQTSKYFVDIISKSMVKK